jgi:flagellar biosynthesis anti-sigma factor FlgM
MRSIRTERAEGGTMEIKNGRRPGVGGAAEARRVRRQSAGRTAGSRPAARGGQADSSRVDLGAGQEAVKRVAAMLAEVPEVDLERVHRIKAELKDGRYQPDLETVAERMIEEALLLRDPGHA